MKDLHHTVLENSGISFSMTGGFTAGIRISVIPSEEQNLARLYVKFTVENAPEHFENFGVVTYLPIPKCSPSYAPFVKQMLTIYNGIVDWISNSNLSLKEIFRVYVEEMEKYSEDLNGQNEAQGKASLELSNLGNEFLPSVINKSLDSSVQYAYQVRFSVFCGEVVSWR